MNTNQLLLSILFCTFSISINAQGLPQTQERSVKAPSNIKIDGKAIEGNNKFEAYNNATDIFYTVSNDSENLYLTVQAKYREVIDNILRGGLTFTVNHSVSHRDPVAVSVTYPVFRDATVADITNTYTRAYNEHREAKDAPVNVDGLNKLLRDRSKLINIEGIKAIPEGSISVYNEDNINAVSLFDTSTTYTYELAIPLKYLSLSTLPFCYHIKINPPAEVHALDHSAPPPPMMTTQLATTDFWGGYVLVKP